MENYDCGILEALQSIAKNLGRIADRLDSWDRTWSVNVRDGSLYTEHNIGVKDRRG